MKNSFEKSNGYPTKLISNLNVNKIRFMQIDSSQKISILSKFLF